jgi:GTP-binding protein
MPASIQFLKSAVLVQDYPAGKKAEVAIAGRSNAGKSSFLNAMAGGKVAKVSATPGKTRLLNFFSVNNKYVLVDMPGYGFAARSNDEVRQWHDMVEAYLAQRETLRGLLLVMDIRRDWSEEEELLKRYSQSEDFGMAIILTKADKMSKNQMRSAAEKMRRQSGVEHVFVTSTIGKFGHEEVEDFVYKNWVTAVANVNQEST